jgi:hypothetical protein
MQRWLLAIGITFAVVALAIGVMVWFGHERHVANSPTQARPDQQADQTDLQRAEAPSPTLPSDNKQAAVEHCRPVQGINAWIVCMERQGINTRELLKTVQ